MVNTSTCRFREEKINTIIKNCELVHSVCRESFYIELCISNVEKISPLTQNL